MRAVVLCFSGLDPSGGAGLQADIEAIAAQGAHAAVVCTALTEQDSERVYSFETVSTDLLLRQAERIIQDLPVAAIKIGMLASTDIADALLHFLKRNAHIPVILDPVLSANSGGSLAHDNLRASLLTLAQHATLITPNSLEARRLANHDDLNIARETLLADYCQAMYLKGGHEQGDTIINELWLKGEDSAQVSLAWQRLNGEYHGSGCTLASAIAAKIAQGFCLADAVNIADKYVYQALKNADRPRSSGQFLPKRI